VMLSRTWSQERWAFELAVSGCPMAAEASLARRKMAAEGASHVSSWCEIAMAVALVHVLDEGVRFGVLAPAGGNLAEEVEAPVAVADARCETWKRDARWRGPSRVGPWDG
jgi:hypothetical protein